tara:strand:- start:324 stop:728 length:405 start_codon:yes stop_codon:yes gene_type:complete
MPVSFEKNIPKHYVHCRMLGESTLEEVLLYISEISVDPELNQPFYEIVDFSEMDELGFGYYEGNHLMDKYKELGKKKGYIGTIFISGNAYGDALSKMFKTTAGFKGISIRVVHSLAEAEVLVDHLITGSDVLGS